MVAGNAVGSTVNPKSKPNADFNFTPRLKLEVIMNKLPSKKRKFEEHVSGASLAFYLLFIVLPLALANFINIFDQPFLKLLCII